MAVRSVISHAPNIEETAVPSRILGKLEYSRNPITEVGNNFDSVKIIRRKNDNFDLTLRKRLFCDAKPTLLPCKTAAFGM
ncbi:hypothetical protein CLI69_06590 [Prevotella intermedia]|nr:hypothetical protein CLI69_06590 [Prevotella intermedia]